MAFTNDNDSDDGSSDGDISDVDTFLLSEKPTRFSRFSKKSKIYLASLTNLLLAGLFVFLMLKESLALGFTLDMAGWPLQLGGGLFAAFALLELVNASISFWNMWQEIKKNHFSLALQHFLGGAASTLAVIASLLVFSNTFFPAFTASLAASLGYGLTSALMATVPIFFTVILVCLSFKTCLETSYLIYESYALSTPRDKSSVNETKLLLFKGYGYLGLTLCVGFGLIGGMGTGICMAVAAALTIGILAITIVQHVKAQNKAKEFWRSTLDHGIADNISASNPSSNPSIRYSSPSNAAASDSFFSALNPESSVSSAAATIATTPARALAKDGIFGQQPQTSSVFPPSSASTDIITAAAREQSMFG